MPRSPIEPRCREWRVEYTTEGREVWEDIVALACEQVAGALFFWDGGLLRVFGAGSWTGVTLQAEEEPF